MYEITEERALNLIKDKERNDNYLFTDVPDTVMDNVRQCVSDPSMLENGYILVDIDPEEVKHIEGMIDYTLKARELKKAQDIKNGAEGLQNDLNKLQLMIKNDPSLTRPLQVAITDLKNRIRDFESKAKEEKRTEELTTFIIASAVGEEYILGNIIKQISRSKELSEKYKIDDIDAKLQYFDKFLNMEGILPEDYEVFNEMRFALIVEWLPLLQFSESELTVCFTNFQNISNPLINCIVNNFTSVNTRKFRTMVFTADNWMLTSELRDEGRIQEPFDYRSYTLDKSKRPKGRTYN